MASAHPASDVAAGAAEDTGCRRQIFISLSSLLHMWDREGDALLSRIPEDALLFFGSKRSWVFPETVAESEESRAENPKYTSEKYQKIRDFILQKEARNEVFFLKPPGFQYNGDLYHGDPEAFPSASAWIQLHEDPATGKPFLPLLLDPAWWKSSFKPESARYTRHVGTIVKNFLNGAHDYAPVMELLHQSNPTLDIQM
mmetsp:Transcript_63572/g.196879  ORF Transcript_63572/g.196879 Transcript_63572/m.196879 type:complete len:199 (+) Transcript_63572:70-666(+)